MPPARQSGIPKLTCKEDQLAQAASMMAARIFEHKTVEEIASDAGVARATVQRRLRLARREGIPEEVRTVFIRDALPAAMAVILDSLKSPNEKARLSAAFKIIDGLEAMKLPEEERAAKKAGAGEDDSYEIWRERIKVTRGAIERASGSIREVDTIIDAVSSPAAESPSPARPDEEADRLLPAPISLRQGPSDRS